MTTVDEQSDELNDDSGIDLDLKNPYVAALLAWIIPGMGHFYQGRTAKANLFAIYDAYGGPGVWHDPVQRKKRLAAAAAAADEEVS